MFTKNFYIGAGLRLIADSEDYISKSGSSLVGEYASICDLVTVDGKKNLSVATTSVQLYSYTLDNYFTSAVANLFPDNGARGFAFGDGTGVPSFNDYTLFGNCVAGYSFSKTTEYKYDGASSSIEVVFTITNNNSEAITISEIGLFDFEQHKNGTSGWKSVLYMIEHTVLDSPITIEPGSVGQVTYTLRLNYPTA